MSLKTQTLNRISRRQWNELRYPILLRELSQAEGGGWLATIPMLGEGAFMADGETAAEAVHALETLRRELYDAVIASGQPIPLPRDANQIEAPNGKTNGIALPVIG